MTSDSPRWPPIHPFPESQRQTIQGIPDFPRGAGDRELGKFRPSAEPRLTQVAVVDDDGRPVGMVLMPAADEQVMLLRAILFGIAQMTDISVDDLLAAGNSA